jgi:hypothetical protein
MLNILKHLNEVPKFFADLYIYREYKEVLYQERKFCYAFVNRQP